MSDDKQERLTALLLKDELFTNTDKFSLLKSLSTAENVDDLAILVAMRLANNEWGVYASIATDIVRSVGLFPYLNNESQLSLRNALAREFYKSPSGRPFFLHKAQFLVLKKLLDGDSIILSAPTSFGKTFIVDELLLNENYSNVMIIVPTIALIEEIRKRVKTLETAHKRISFSNQVFAKKNIFILTQERAHEMLPQIRESIGELDLLVIDEFYKMDKTLLTGEDKNNSGRADLLSVVYREFSAVSKQIYLLGPHLQGANGYDTNRHKPVWIQYNNNTTYLEFIRKKATKDHNRGKITAEIVEKEQEDILVYCSSPDQTRKLYIDYLSGNSQESHDNDDLIDWVTENFTAEWYVIDALRHGVGIHHGRLPRFLSQEMIRRFADGRVKVLLCTSTIIEGVNTTAKSVVIFNNSRAFNGGYLTFRNISGRAGRMFRHFYGKVYCFEEPPKDEIVEVNDPIGTDSINTNPGLLNLLDVEHLSKDQKGNVSEHRLSTNIPLEIQKLNHFIPLALQQQVIDMLRNPEFPSQLDQVKDPDPDRSKITQIYRLTIVLGLNLGSMVHSGDPDNASYRAAVLTQSFFSGGVIDLATNWNVSKGLTDETIEQALSFMRNGMGYSIPKYVRALSRLYKHATNYTRPGNLEPFANRLEFLNTEPVYMQLDELGVPVEFSKKHKLPVDSIDEAANMIKRRQVNLTGFDRYIVDNFIDSY